MVVKDYYKILEVHRNSSLDDIKVAFRRLAKKYHPNLNGGNKTKESINMMADIQEAYSILSNNKKRAEYDKQYNLLFESHRQNSKEKQEKLKEEQDKKTQERRSLDEYFWDGSNPKKYLIREKSFEKFRDRILQSLVKDEFETTSEFEHRKKVIESELLNNFLGTQSISMKYDADSQQFAVEINRSLKFTVSVPRKIAKDFKHQVKRFLVRFSKDLEIIAISVNFRGNLYLGKNFDKSWISREIVEVKMQEEIEEEEECNTLHSLAIFIIGIFIGVAITSTVWLFYAYMSY